MGSSRAGFVITTHIFAKTSHHSFQAYTIKASLSTIQFFNMKPPEPSLGPPPSPLLHTHTPPSSPPLLPNSRGITVDDLKQALVEIVQAANKSDSGNETKAEAADNAQADEPKRAASKVEYKMVDEVYVFRIMHVSSANASSIAGTIRHTSTRQLSPRCLRMR